MDQYSIKRLDKGQFLDNWITRALQTNLGPMKKVANMLKNYKTLIMNWFKAKGLL